MLSAPCFINGIAPTLGRSPVVAQQIRGSRDLYSSAVVGGSTEISATSSGQSRANGVCTFVVFLGLCRGASRRRSNHSRIYRCQSASVRSSSLIDNRLEDTDSDRFDYVLEGGAEYSLLLPAARSDDPASSFTAYMTRPVQAILRVPLPAGISLQYVGPKKAANGSTEEFFRLKLPPIEFPGIVSMKGVSPCFVKGSAERILIEGNELSFTGGVTDLENANKNVRFFNRTVVTWVDKRNCREIRVKTNVSIKLDPPRMYRILLPKVLFRTMGNGITKLIMGVIQKGFARAFVKDYALWEMDENRK